MSHIASVFADPARVRCLQPCLLTSVVVLAAACMRQDQGAKVGIRGLGTLKP